MAQSGDVPRIVSAARERSGSTVEELAEALAASPAAIRRWESGDEEVTPADLRRLNRVLGFTPTDVAAIEAETGILLDLAVATGSTTADHLRRTTSPAWIEAEKLIGCPFSGGGLQPHRLEGWVDGYRVVVEEVSRGDGREAVRFRVGYESLGVGLRLKRGDWASHVASRFAPSAVIIGHRRFDEMFVVKADDRDRAGGLLRGMTADVLVRLGTDMPTVTVSDEELSAIGPYPHHRGDAAALAATTRRLVDVVVGFASPPAHRRPPRHA